MKPKSAFTKKDLVVVLACIAFLLANITAVGRRGRKRAQSAVCLSKLMKWGKIFQAYTADNDGFFHSRPGLGYLESYLRMWPYVYKPYYENPGMRFCPTAADCHYVQGSFGVWNLEYGNWDPTRPKFWIPGEKGSFLGSYGINRFIPNYLGAYAIEPAWWRRTGVKCAAQVPVFFDAQYVCVWGNSDALPPEYEGDWGEGDTQAAACLNRHMGHTNVLFMDWSVRRIGLKQLWTLKWSRTYDTCDKWTICGNGGDVNACAAEWDAAAPWMKDFPEY